MTFYLHSKERRDLGQGMKYVELLLVADHAEVRPFMKVWWDEHHIRLGLAPKRLET